jgi:hypothetical protein
MNKLFLRIFSSCLMSSLKRKMLFVMVGGMVLSSQAALHDEGSTPCCSFFKRPLSIATASNIRGRIQTTIDQINRITQQRSQLYKQITDLDSEITSLQEMKRSFETEDRKFSQLMISLLQHRQKDSNTIAADVFDAAYQKYILPELPFSPYYAKFYLDTTLLTRDFSTDDRKELKWILGDVSTQLAVAQAGYGFLVRDVHEKETTHRTLSAALAQEGITPEKRAQLLHLQETLKTELLARRGTADWIAFSPLARCLMKYAQARDGLELTADQAPTFSSLLKLFKQYGYGLPQESIV